MNESEVKEIKQEEKDWKNRIHEYRKDAVSQFNKQLVYLSSGGLILTIGFVKGIVNLSTSKCNFFLVLAWLFFTLSLLMNLISYKSTMKSMDFELNDRCDESDRQDMITNRLDNGSLYSLILAILTFVFFLSINIL